MLSGSFFIGNCQMYALRGLKQGNPKTSLTSMGNNYRPIQPTHYRPVRTNIDFTSTEVIDYIAEQSTSLSLSISLSLSACLFLWLFLPPLHLSVALLKTSGANHIQQFRIWRQPDPDTGSPPRALFVESKSFLIRHLIERKNNWHWTETQNIYKYPGNWLFNL